MRGVAALRDQWRQPADFQLQAHIDQQVGLAQLEQEAGLGFDEVRILIALGHRFYVDRVAADFLGQGGHVGGRGDDVQFLGRRKRWAKADLVASRQILRLPDKYPVVKQRYSCQAPRRVRAVRSQ